MRSRKDETAIRIEGSILGDRLRFGRVGYAGAAFAPAEGTYRSVAAGRAKLTTIQDSGRTALLRGELAKLYPLAAAALYEVAFVREAGPLDTWRN